MKHVLSWAQSSLLSLEKRYGTAMFAFWLGVFVGGAALCMWLYARDRVQEDIIFEPIALAEEEAVVTAPPPVVSQTSLTPPVDPTPPNEQQSATIEDQSEDKININTATQSQLESLPGVGPVIAQRIIQHRPYSSIFDIQRVPGIGKKRYEQIAERITID